MAAKFGYDCAVVSSDGDVVDATALAAMAFLCLGNEPHANTRRRNECH